MKQLNAFFTDREAEVAYILSYAARTGHGKMIPLLEEKGVAVDKAMAFMAGTGQVENLKLMHKYASPRMKETFETEQLMDLATYYRAVDKNDEKTIDRLEKNRVSNYTGNHCT